MKHKPQPLHGYITNNIRNNVAYQNTCCGMFNYQLFAKNIFANRSTRAALEKFFETQMCCPSL